MKPEKNDGLFWDCPNCGERHTYEKPILVDLRVIASNNTRISGKCCGRSYRLTFDVKVTATEA